MKRISLHLCGCLAAVVSALSSCSITEHVPSGEYLYTGIKRIVYETERSSGIAPRNTPTDSTGVIASIADAVGTVESVMSGNARKTPLTESEKAEQAAKLAKEERRRQKIREKSERRTMTEAREEISAVLAYAPNGALFGSSSFTSPLKFGLRVYNQFADSETAVGKWLFNTFAEAPILVSNVSPATRAKVAANTLRNFGYFRAETDHEVLVSPDRRKARLAYYIKPGRLFYLDSVAYVGFDPVADSLLSRTRRECLLRKGEAFNVRHLTGEQSRIETLMRNNGYFFYAPGHTVFQADTMAQKGFVQLRVLPSPGRPQNARRPWHIGHTHITIRDAKGTPVAATLEVPNYTFRFSGKKIPLRAGIWQRAIAHRHGNLYSLADQRSTLERLYGMGVFSSMDIDYVPQDTTSAADTLDLYITANMAPAYDSSFEMYGTLKSNEQIGPGVSYELAKHNAFRGGETVEFKINGNYDWQMGSGRNGGNSLLNSYQLGTQLSFKFPRLLLPGFMQSRADRMFHRSLTDTLARRPSPHLQPAFLTGQNRPVVGSTVFSLNADWRNRSGFFQLVTMGGDMTYKWYRHPRYTHELTLLNLEYNRILSTTAAFDSITSANPALFASMRNQFIPSLSYSFTYCSRETSRHPKWMQFTVKESGNVLSAFYKAFGKSFSTQEKLLFGSPFAQFVKATAEFRYSRMLSSRFRLATRAFAGAVYSYGNSSHAPYSEQFYIGGANSVRAFSVRTAGPGGYDAPTSVYSYIDQTGDIKLEANAELRAHLFGSLHGAVFLDAGNIWLMKSDLLRPQGEISAANLRRIAVGTGFGLRYDLQFLVLRFDVGVGLHAPYTTERKGFYNIPRFRDGLAYHFAIGYPF